MVPAGTVNSEQLSPKRPLILFSFISLTFYYTLDLHTLFYDFSLLFRLTCFLALKFSLIFQFLFVVSPDFYLLSLFLGFYFILFILLYVTRLFY